MQQHDSLSSALFGNSTVVNYDYHNEPGPDIEKFVSFLAKLIEITNEVYGDEVPPWKLAIKLGDLEPQLVLVNVCQSHDKCFAMSMMFLDAIKNLSHVLMLAEEHPKEGK